MMCSDEINYQIGQVVLSGYFYSLNYVADDNTCTFIKDNSSCGFT
jgi:hypothetical protein